MPDTPTNTTETSVEEDHLDLSQTIKLLEDFAGYDFGGKWSFKSLDEVHKFNPEFKSKEGKARLKFQLSNFIGITNATYIDLTVNIYDGNYINDNTEISTQFRLVSGVSDGLKESNKYVRIDNGHMFTKPSSRQVLSDLRLRLAKDEHTGSRTASFKLVTTKESDMSIEIDFTYPYNFKVSGWRIFFYSTVLFGI